MADLADCLRLEMRLQQVPTSVSERGGTFRHPAASHFHDAVGHFPQIA